MNLSGRKIAGFIGAGLVALSVFLPMVDTLGTISMYERYEDYAYAVLTLSGLAALIALVGWYKYLVWIGYMLLFFMTGLFLMFKYRIGISDFVGSLEGTIHDMGIGSLGYGWVVMGTGTLLLLTVGYAIFWKR